MRDVCGVDVVLYSYHTTDMHVYVIPTMQMYVNPTHIPMCA